MIALFLGVTIALGLLAWAEWTPRTQSDGVAASQSRAKTSWGTRMGHAMQAWMPVRGRGAATLDDDPAVPPLDEVYSPTTAEAKTQARPETAPDAEIMARVAATLTDAQDAPDEELSLPRITGFSLGDTIALELDGPAPERADIRFIPARSGPHAIALIEGEPSLLIENVEAGQLSPEIVSFHPHTA